MRQAQQLGADKRAGIEREGNLGLLSRQALQNYQRQGPRKELV